MAYIFLMAREQYTTVVETSTFLSDVAQLLSEEERANFVAFIAANPQRGDLKPRTGGLRKIRWAIRGRGKRGGMRAIYYYHSEHMPLFLLTTYGKSVKDNLTEAEKGIMRRLVQQLKEQFLR